MIGYYTKERVAIGREVQEYGENELKQIKKENSCLQLLQFN